MRFDHLLLVGSACVVAGVSWWIGRGSELGPSLVLVVFFFLVALVAGTRLATDADPWLRTLLPVAFALKMAATFARWGMVEFLYGFGDSVAYHDAGVLHAATWSRFEVPEIVGRSMGTRFVENVTAMLYVPYEPHLLGGFFYFAVFAFVGQVLFYLAYRRAVPGRYLFPYAIFVFGLPTLAFWPSSIGKDALMIGFLGLVFYGAARLVESFQLRFTPVIGLGLWGAAVIRSHVALLAAASIILTALLMRKPTTGVSVSVRRVLLVAVAMVGAIGVATLFAETFGLGEGGGGPLTIDLAFEDLDPVVADIERRTGQGRSSVDAGAVDSIANLPAGFARVLFAPFPWQAHNAQAFFASLEGLILIGIFVWSLPALIGSLGSYRRNPYVLMAVVYTGGFGVAFSAILNLGIMTRQRSQVTALFLVMCFGAREILAEKRARGRSERLAHDRRLSAARPS